MNVIFALKKDGSCIKEKQASLPSPHSLPCVVHRKTVSVGVVFSPSTGKDSFILRFLSASLGVVYFVVLFLRLTFK